MNKTIKEINVAFPREIESGLIEIIVPPRDYYPDLNQLRPDTTFLDSQERVKWRTKQNFDFAYLMTYSEKRSTYYLQVRSIDISFKQKQVDLF